MVLVSANKLPSSNMYVVLGLMRVLYTALFVKHLPSRGQMALITAIACFDSGGYVVLFQNMMVVSGHSAFNVGHAVVADFDSFLVKYLVKF